jgi:hypothetical protein
MEDLWIINLLENKIYSGGGFLNRVSLTDSAEHAVQF